MTSVTPPEELTYGKVVGRFLLSVADTTDDPDRLPDAIAAEGLTVTLTPKTLVQRVEGSSPVTVLRSSTTCTVGADGWLHDPAGAEGVWLVTGVYTVSYKATGLSGFSVPSQHTIEVTAAHDDDTPLDLTTAIPYVPPTGVTATTIEVVGSPVEGYVIGHVGGQTKWVEPVRDTGTRNITSLFEGSTTRWDLAPPASFSIRRVGNLVNLFIRITMKADVTVASGDWWMTLPSGFRPPAPVYSSIPQTTLVGPGIEVWDGDVSFVLGSTATPSTSVIIVTALTYFTADPWPATLPGSPG